MSLHALALALLLGNRAAVAGSEAAATCPKGSAAARTADARRPWVCVLTAKRYASGIDCPSGASPVVTTDVYDPLKCALDEIEPPLTGGQCPPGSRAAPSAISGVAYECVRGTGSPAGYSPPDPCPEESRMTPVPGRPGEYRCRPRHRRVRPRDPGAEPGAASPDESHASRPGAARFLRYTAFQVPRQIAFDIPKDWQVIDEWNGAAHSLSFKLDLRSDGKPVLLTVSLHRKGGPGFIDADAAISGEIEARGAKTRGRGSVAGMRADFLETPEESRTAYLRAQDGYFKIDYSAPSDVFAMYGPAYERLLKSFRLLNSPPPREK